MTANLEQVDATTTSQRISDNRTLRTRAGLTPDASATGMAPIFARMWVLSLIDARRRRVIGTGPIEQIRIIDASLRLFGVTAILPLIHVETPHFNREYRVVKRTMGPTASIIGISPVLAFLAISVRLASEGPDFFRQTRVGLAARSPR